MRHGGAPGKRQGSNMKKKKGKEKSRYTELIQPQIYHATAKSKNGGFGKGMLVLQRPLGDIELLHYRYLPRMATCYRYYLNYT